MSTEDVRNAICNRSWVSRAYFYNVRIYEYNVHVCVYVCLDDFPVDRTEFTSFYKRFSRVFTTKKKNKFQKFVSFSVEISHFPYVYKRGVANISPAVRLIFMSSRLYTPYSKRRFFFKVQFHI